MMVILRNNLERCSAAALLLWALLTAGARGFVVVDTRRSHHQQSVLVPPLLGMSSSSSSSSSTSTKQTKLPGTAQLPVAWEDLGFEFRPTNSHIKITYSNGAGWGEPELVHEPYVQLHIGATALHYGQACFEGLKAFCHDDNSVHVFRPTENAQRMQASCRRILMPELPTELFLQAVEQVVCDNLEFVPPYGSGGSLYIRPLLFGSGPRIGLQPADEYTFLILVIPVGDYYHGGLSKPVNGLLIEDYDRAAPHGVGSVKVAGNYAADLLPSSLCKKAGFPIGLYLDAATHSRIEEFSTSNFVGIDNTNQKYVTPKSSSSVLPSITNKSLMQIASDQLGLTVEQRDILVDEMETFDEVLAVGTAVVVTPVGSITRLLLASSSDDDEKQHPPQQQETTKRYQFGEPGQIGTTTQRLYDSVRAIQFGEAEDVYGWNYKVEY